MKELFESSYLSIMSEENDRIRKEIERQKEIIRQLDIKNLELTTIIKEVREKITSLQISYLGLRSGKTFIATLLNDILEILDKENNNEDN